MIINPVPAHVHIAIDEIGSGLEDPNQLLFGVGVLAFDSAASYEEAVKAAVELKIASTLKVVEATPKVRRHFREWLNRRDVRALFCYVRLDDPNIRDWRKRYGDRQGKADDGTI